MSLKYGTDAVTDVKYRVNSTDNIVTVIQDASGTVYYARPGRLIIDSPTGVTAMTVTRTGGLEPTASTGVLSSNSTVYHGDVLEVRPTMDPRYQATYPASTTVNFISTTSFVASSVLQVSPVENSITIPAAAHATITYKYQAPGSPTVTTATTLDTTVTVWGQTTFTYTWAPAAYYKITSGATGSFKITQNSTVPAATIAQKRRGITVYNPDQLANIFIFAGGECVASTSSYTVTSASALVPSEYGITYGVTDYRYDNNTIWYENVNGDYPAADNETGISATFKAHVFNLGTYDCGTITYYNGSTKITQGTVAGYNVYTYKLTAKNDGYFLHNSAYTRTITGTLNTRPTNQNSAWKPFAEQDVYYKLDIKTYRRGAIYYAANAHFVKVADNSPITTHSFNTYVKEGDTVQSYADYVNYADQTDGIASSLYGNVGDSYTSSAAAQSTTITGNTTITYSGTLISRTVNIQPRYGSDILNGSYKYYNTDGSLRTYTWSGASSALTTTYVSIPSVWCGSFITATYSRSSTRYVYVSGFDSRGPNPNATTYTLCASYNALLSNSSNSGSTTNVSVTQVGGVGYYVVTGKLSNSSTQITLTYPSTSYSYSGYKLTATYTYYGTSTLMVTATFSGANTYNPKTITLNIYDVPQPSVVMDSDWGGRTNQIVAYVANPITTSLRLNYQVSCTYFNPSTERLETMTSSSTTTTISGQSTPTGIYAPFSSSVPSDCTIYSYSITCSFTNTTVGFTGKSITKTYQRPESIIQQILTTEDYENGGWIRIEADSYGAPSSTPTSYGESYSDYVVAYGKDSSGLVWFQGYYDGAITTYTLVGQEELDLQGYTSDFYDIWNVNDDPHYYRATLSSLENGESLGVYLTNLLA